MENVKKYNYYENLDNIPIYNIHMLMNSGDLRYLIITENINEIELNEKEINDLIKISDNLFSQLPKIDLTIQILYFFALESYYKFIRNEGALQTVNSTFNRYLTYLTTNYENFIFGEKKFKTADDFYNYVKKISDYNDLIQLRLDLFDYVKINASNKFKIDLIYEVIQLRDITNQQIDIKNTSYSEYLKIRKYANDKINSLSNVKKN